MWKHGHIISSTSPRSALASPSSRTSAWIGSLLSWLLSSVCCLSWSWIYLICILCCVGWFRVGVATVCRGGAASRGQGELSSRLLPAADAWGLLASSSPFQVIDNIPFFYSSFFLYQWRFFSRHYFAKDEVAEFLFTKLYNGIMKASTLPPLDRLFTVPRRVAIQKLGEKYPKYDCYLLQV